MTKCNALMLCQVLVAAAAVLLPGAAADAGAALPPNGPVLSPPFEVYPICKVPGPAVVTISSTQISDRAWRGWGTTLSWFGNYIGGLPQKQFDELMDLLYDPNVGLGLNIARYNIGGGRNATNSPVFDWPSLNYWHAVPGFKPTETGPYNWTADERQRRCLLGAKARGADTFMAVSFSPPWWATVSGDVAGSLKPYETNLAADKFNVFADYASEVIRRYATDPQWNITFDVYEPMNEPSLPWRAGGAQESSFYSARDKAKLVPLMAAAFKSKGLATELAGFDEWVLTEWRNLNTSAVPNATVSSLSQLHVHGYVTLYEPVPWYATEGAYSKLRENARRVGKDVWMSEWTFLKHAGSELDLALVLARNIMETVNFMGASAYVFWQALDTTERFSLIWVQWDPYLKNSYPHRVTKKFWALKHFTRFAPPGSFLVLPTSTTGCEHCVTSFYDAATSTLAVFVVNQKAEAVLLYIDVSGFQLDASSPGVPAAAWGYRTSVSENCASIGTLVWSSPAGLEFSAAGRSLSTLVFQNVKRLDKGQVDTK